MNIKRLSTVLGCVLLAAPLPALAINKCIAADGKVSFQEQPCPGKGGAIEVKPASGAAYAPAPSQATNGAMTSSTNTAPPTRKEGVFGDTYRRKLDLETHLISNAKGELSSHLKNCDAQQQALAAKKGQARNNLAGATWEQSISAEMQAAATTCDTKARDIRARLEGYEKELRELQASKP